MTIDAGEPTESEELLQGAAPVQNLPPLLGRIAHPWWTLGAGLLGIAIVLVCGVLITASPSWAQTELGVLQAVSNRHVPFFDALSVWIAIVFGTTFGAPLLFVWCVVLSVLSRRVTMGLTFLIFVGFAWLGDEAIKVIVHRPRPDYSLLSHPLSIEHTFSYPSGHTCFVASIAITIILIFRGSRRQPLAIAIGVAATLIVAASRVYLGVHHPSDVVASMLYASCAIAVIMVLWNNYALPRLLWLDRPFQRAQLPGPNGQ